jgi:hypothetical protein
MAVAAFTLPKGTDLDETKPVAATAGWGHAGKAGVALPGKIIERDCTAAESAAGAALSERRPFFQEKTAVKDCRIAAIFLLEPMLDSNDQKVKQHT